MAEGGNGSTSAVHTVLRASVARLYSNLVTRPTGRAVRMAIERQLAEVQGASLAILDFSEVGIVDFSCADEVIAKLLLRHREPEERVPDAFFLAQGVCEHHREPIEVVLARHGLVLVTVDVDGRRDLWGATPTRLRRAWQVLDRLGRAVPGELAAAGGWSRATAEAWLRRLVSRRVAVPDGEGCVCSLSLMMESDRHPIG